MEVHFAPEVEQRLRDLAATTGRATVDLVHDVVAGYLDDLTAVREMLEERFDSLKNGRVQPIDGEEALSRLRAKSEGRRSGAA